MGDGIGGCDGGEGGAVPEGEAIAKGSGEGFGGDPVGFGEGGEPEEDDGAHEGEGEVEDGALALHAALFVPGAEGEPARGDHLGEVVGVVGPEFGSGGAQAFGAVFGFDEADADREGEPEGGHVGERFEGIGDGAGDGGVVFEAVAVAFVEGALLGLTEGGFLDALPDDGEAEDGFETIGLADLLHFAGEG